MLTELTREIQRKTLKCPECEGEIRVYWGRRGKRWNAHHPIRNCPERFTDFGHGATEESAWEEARTICLNINKTNETK